MKFPALSRDTKRLNTSCAGLASASGRVTSSDADVWMPPQYAHVATSYGRPRFLVSATRQLSSTPHSPMGTGSGNHRYPFPSHSPLDERTCSQDTVRKSKAHVLKLAQPRFVRKLRLNRMASSATSNRPQSGVPTSGITLCVRHTPARAPSSDGKTSAARSTWWAISSKSRHSSISEADPNAWHSANDIVATVSPLLRVHATVAAHNSMSSGDSMSKKTTQFDELWQYPQNSTPLVHFASNPEP
mmetsp:Transcript_31332/g.87860  ORF Transcript_31332/g.87860 Transcript_31332/m.87860 type:complete len:244 (-) Transcript_31332:95-826(-)